jgi:glycosyltransferase involved in cell wall biosynthesis
VSFVTWDEHWGTPQQLMSRLAKRNRVLYVEQPMSPLSFLTGIRGRDVVMRQVRRWRQGPRLVSENLWAAAPPLVLPLRTNRIVNAINAWVLRRWLSRAARRLGLNDVLYWNVQPSLPGLARAVRPAMSLFHCVDDFSALPHWWHQPGSLLAREAEACREADVVVCTARKLMESRRQYNANIHFVPNAGNVELFARSRLPETRVPDDIAALPGKIVGIFGVIDFRLDVDLLAYVASRRPDWSIALVGLIKGDVDLAPLRALPNVHILGRKPADELPGYLKAMDVCLIAYALNEYTHHVFPLKLYDYMAAGKPIVATDMEELRPIAGPHLRIGRTRDGFVTAIEDAMAYDSPEQAKGRVAEAARQSWDQRVEEISSIIEPMLRERARRAGAAVQAPAKGLAES